jgi:hypothetical protein
MKAREPSNIERRRLTTMAVLNDLSILADALVNISKNSEDEKSRKVAKDVLNQIGWPEIESSAVTGEKYE